MSQPRQSSRWRARRPALIVGMVLPALSAMAQPQPGRILSTTTLDIFDCNIDGSNCVIVAGHGDNSTSRQPSAANDGTIAFSGNLGVDLSYDGSTRLFLMNADGTNVRQITHSPPNTSEQWPTISPDGTKIAFLANINTAPDTSRDQEIYLVNADGSNLRQLTPFLSSQSGDYSQSSMSAMAWSPDSTKVAFRGSIFSSQCGTYEGSPIFVNIIGVINADGTGMQMLACDNNDGYVTSLDWSPDGTLIAWGRNVSHGAQGCSGCVGEPAIAFLDLSGHNRYSAGIRSSQLGTDSCSGGPHCIHFSPDGSRLAYQNQYGQTTCGGISCVALINLDGSDQTNTTMQFAAGLWWIPGARIPQPAQLSLAGSIPNVPPNPVEVWPGFSDQLIPTLSDINGNSILKSAASYTLTHYFYESDCLAVGPFGLAVYQSTGNGYGTISAADAGQTSNTLSFKCWGSPPCTYSLGAAGVDVPSGGGAGSVSISADPGSSGSSCPWVTKAGASWITITSGPAGSGNGAIRFNTAANTGAARQATITAGGLNYAVFQDAAAAGPPVIEAIADAWDYVPGVAPGEWVTIGGTALATGPGRTWSITGTQLPTSLGDVSVFFGATPAVLSYVSPTQINALVPATVTPGPVQVTVQADGLTSAPFTIAATAAAPSIYAPPNADGSAFFVTAALAGTATLIGNSATDPRVVRAARPGDTLDLYMIGLGTTRDSSKFVTDQLFAGAYPVLANVTASVGNQPANVVFAGLISPGLYLVRIQVPAVGPGPQTIQVTAGDAQTRPSLKLAVEAAP